MYIPETNNFIDKGDKNENSVIKSRKCTELEKIS